VAARTVTHDTFVLERTYDAPRSRVFRAFADPATKVRWFSGPDGWTTTERSMEFRVGGHEVDEGGPPGGPLHRFAATYYDILPDRRIVYSYDLSLDGVRLSVSLTTVELLDEGGRTRLVLTEQGAFLDGLEDPRLREEGTSELLEALALVVDDPQEDGT
jgi:uncharacterized protein YndB with AHSA1/START domain